MKIQGQAILWHRWLGIASCVLFLIWFVSGITMMYARMPQLTAEERLSRLPVLNWSQVQLTAAEAWRQVVARGAPWKSASLTTIAGEPSYRFIDSQGAKVIVSASTGAVRRAASPEVSLHSVAAFSPNGVCQFQSTLTTPDQWTVQRTYTDHLPIHRFQCAEGHTIYASGQTGEVILETTPKGRLLAWISAIPHWLYLRAIRVYADEWRLGVIWLSGIGTVMAILGLLVGLWRYSPSRRYRMRELGPRTSPYLGPKRWHHVIGLVFGLTVITFTLSGMLSLNPGRWSTGSSPSPKQLLAFQGGPIDPASFHNLARTAPAWRDAKELEFARLWGEPVAKSGGVYYRLDGTPQPAPSTGTLRQAVENATSAKVVSERTLSRYEAYYYDRKLRKPLPVMEFKTNDAAATWFYVDPSSGVPVNRYEWTGRWERWLYHGLHSLDLPWLWERRPLWDIVVILFSIGGIVVSWTGIQIGYERLKPLWRGRTRNTRETATVAAAAALLLLLSISAWGQTSTLSGQVRDATGAMSGAAVALKTSSVGRILRETTTDAEGRYSFDRLTPARYEIVFTKAGFATTAQSVVVGDGSERLDVVLDVAQVETTMTVVGSAEVSALRLDSPATGGTRLDLPVRELPMTLSIVSQEMIQERGARSVIETVETAVGMVAGTSVGSIPSFATRGFSGNNVTIMRDGMRQNTSSQSARPLDSYQFEQVEVLKGPASILYGEGAIGGAINMVSKAPTSALLVDGLFSYGSFGTYRGGVGVSGPIGKNVFARVDASRSGTDGYMDNSGQNLSSIDASVRWNATERMSILAAANWNRDSTASYYGTPLIDGKIDPRTRFLNYNMRDNLARSFNRFARLNLDWRLGGNWRLRNEGFLATHKLDWRNFESYAFNATTRLVDVSSYFLIWRDDLLVGNRLDLTGKKQIWGRTLRLNLGGQYQNNMLQRGGLSNNTLRVSLDPFAPRPHFDPGLQYVRDRDVQIGTNSLFAEATYDLTSKLKAIGGIRYENINLKFFNIANRTLARNSYQPVTGRGGLLYQLTPTLNAYFSYTKAVEPVTQLVSLSGTQQAFSLVPGEQYEAGVKATVWRGRADLTAAYFDIEKRDILTTTIVNGVQFSQQIGSQKARGVEAAFSVRPTSSLTLVADIALTNAKFGEFNEFIGGGLVSRTGNLPQNVPETVLGVWANQRFRAFDLSGNLRHVGRRFADTANLRAMDSYTVFDAALAYRLPKGFRVMLRGRNLTNNLYAAWSVSGGTALRLEAPRGADVTVTMRF
jgi:iron complex outermembrane recepter protein